MTIAQAEPTDAAETPTPPMGSHGWLWVELGNGRPEEVVRNAEGETRTPQAGPRVTYVKIPYGEDAAGVQLYSFPKVHTDELFACTEPHTEAHLAGRCPTADLAETLASIPEGEPKRRTRRMLLQGHLSAPSGVTHLANHAAFVALFHPGGAWNSHAAVGSLPTWVRVTGWGYDGIEEVAAEFQRFIADYANCPEGAPDHLEDTHWTAYGAGSYMPGAIPDPAAGITALHTSWGRDLQALGMFGSGALNVNGTATATSATSLTGGTETGTPTHVANDAAGMILVILTAADNGKWAFVKSNTSGTAPVYTVDQWYAVNSPGGAAATTPGATSVYSLVEAGAIRQFVSLTTDSTTPALAGAAGTADAPLATTALTSEITTAAGGLKRKIAPVAHTAGQATVTHTPVFTANGSDALPVTVAKAADCASNVAGGGGIGYMTLVSPTVVFSASGDQMTLTWTFTET